MKLTKISCTIAIPFMLSIGLLTPIQNVYASQDSSDLSVENVETSNIKRLLSEAEANPYLDVQVNGDDFTITFTDADFYKASREFQGLPTNRIPRANGVNKIQGKLTSGNFKVYVTGKTLNAVKNLGAPALGFLLGGGWGFVASSIYSVTQAENNFQHGRVFVYQGFQYQYWYYQ